MNQMNKAICLLLAFVLVFGLAVSVNAAEAPAAQESLTDAAEWKPETIEAADEQAVITAENCPSTRHCWQENCRQESSDSYWYYSTFVKRMSRSEEMSMSFARDICGDTRT